MSCKYCQPPRHDEETEPLVTCDNKTVRIKKGMLKLEYPTHYTIASEVIRYCPMCGRKL